MAATVEIVCFHLPSSPTLKQCQSGGKRCCRRTLGTARHQSRRRLVRRDGTSLPVSQLSSRHWRLASSGESSGGAGVSTVARDSSSSTSSSTSSSETEAQSSGESQEQGPHLGESSAPGGGKEGETKDVLALRSLDAYFEKLKGPEKEKDTQAEPMKAESSSAPVAVTVDRLAPQAPKQPEEAAKSSDVGSEQLQEDETLQLLRNLIELAETKQQGQGAKDKDAEKTPDNVSIQVTLGGPNEYQQWVSEQLVVNPPTAVNIFLALNIAVFLFELASPEAVPGLIVTSLPSLLGAKVNALIAAGEWWRLVTPMFLHAGIFHILLSSVVLLSWGPPVEAAFGSFGFFAAYLVGGVFGNLLSFIQTPEVTVGGTGPLYGMVGAYLVYLYKNRQAMGKDDANATMGSLIFFAALNVAVGSTLPVDDWTHIGAALGGLTFGALAAPRLTRNDRALGSNPPATAQKVEGGEKGLENKELGAGGESPGIKGAQGAWSLFTLKRGSLWQQALAMGLCLGFAVLLLEFSSTPIPDGLLDVTANISSV